MKEYRVRVTPHFSLVVWATNARQAKDAAWMEIKDGFTYGYRSKLDFIRGTKAEQMYRPG